MKFDISRYGFVVEAGIVYFSADGTQRAEIPVDVFIKAANMIEDAGEDLE